MRSGVRTRAFFWVFALVVLAFIYVPLGVVAINSFNSDRTFGWPPPGLTTQWWSAALKAPGPRDALRTSVEAGLGATAIASCWAVCSRWLSRGTGSSGGTRSRCW